MAKAAMERIVATTVVNFILAERAFEKVGLVSKSKDYGKVARRQRNVWKLVKEDDMTCKGTACK